MALTVIARVTGSSSETSSEESTAVSSDEQVHVRHIFLPLPPAASPDEEKEVLQQITDIRKRTQDGEDFATLATAHSRGPGADQGGDLGFFKKGQMAKEIDDVAFSLKPGEVSQPFRNNAGVHLIKVEERTGSTSKPVAASASAPEKKNTSAIDPAVAEQIKQKLYNEALRQRYERWFQEDLRFRHQVENFLVADSSSATSFTPKSARPKSSASDNERAGREARIFPATVTVLRSKSIKRKYVKRKETRSLVFRLTVSRSFTFIPPCSPLLA